MREPEASWLTVQEVADLIHASKYTVIRLLHKGTLPGVYLGTREGWRVRRADVDTLVPGRQQKAEATDGHPEKA